LKTKVINIKNAPRGWRDDPSYVYIGRPSQWGNPFRSKDLGRAKAILEFTVWFRGRLASDIWLWRELRTLRGKTLVCFCKPLDCHGDVMARMMEYPPVCPGTEGQMALRVPYDGPGLEDVPEPERRSEVASIQRDAWAATGREDAEEFVKEWTTWEER